MDGSSGTSGSSGSSGCCPTESTAVPKYLPTGSKMIEYVYGHGDSNDVLGVPDYWILFTGIIIGGNPTDIKVPGYDIVP